MPRPLHPGDLIAAMFGVVFVAANSQLLGAARLPVIVVAIAAGIAIVVAAQRSRGMSGAAGPPMHRTAYLRIVAVEAVALVVGAPLLARFAPHLPIAWVALVVGLHFVAFAVWWLPGERTFLAIGAVMTVLGVLGFAIGLTGGEDTADVVALVAGVGSGVTLLVPSTIAAVRLFSARAA
ncbi:hypothetical protein [Actinomycetospora corticicola]|uniref:Uncharacterized protein n=1 Tax=Actinomycetospora corticicola TaxID=663602 RepID=A0A7Y9DUI5_9PSEU|nr:hypothetical protein [Actinomycetospora corticicola]NYD35666.1 hypothetical protein [Actinomycetospora corticicola]